MQSEEYELIRRASEGEERAFEELVRAYERRVFAYAYRMLSNREDAEEVTQDVFVKVWRTLGRFRGDCSFSSWILKITRNTATDVLRRRQETVAPLFSEHPTDASFLPEPYDLSPASNPPEAYLKAEREETVARAIAALPPDFRQILLLREMEGLSYAEIGEVLSIEEGTVKSRISRARQALKKILTDWNFFL